MKRISVCILMVLCLILSACSVSELNKDATIPTVDGTETGSTVDADASSEGDPVEYETSEKTEYEGETGSDVMYAIEADGEIISNPWINVEDEETDDEGIRHSVENEYYDLSVPTWYTFLDGLYFIVDCYHNQIIYSDSMEKPLHEWKVMDKELKKPHTIAFDGEVYMVDDTDNNKVVAYKKVVNEDGSLYFERVQEFVDMGEEPHYVVYKEENARFYAWSSKSGQMWVFRRSKDSSMIFLDESYNIPPLKDVYVRSFTFLDDKAYFVSGTNGSCTIFETTTDNFDVLREYPVAPEIGGMVQLTKIQDYFYITVSTSLYGERELRNIVRTDSLEHLQMGQFESLYDLFIGSEYPGTPYNITYVDDRWCISVHRDGMGPRIVYFNVVDNEIQDIGSYY